MRGILLVTVGCFNVDVTGVGETTGGADVALGFPVDGSKSSSPSSRIVDGFGVIGNGRGVVTLLVKLDEKFGGREKTGSTDALLPLNEGRGLADPLRSLENAKLGTFLLGVGRMSATKTLRAGLRVGSSRACVLKIVPPNIRIPVCSFQGELPCPGARLTGTRLAGVRLISPVVSRHLTGVETTFGWVNVRTL
jgi:hypothetical protein